jgi:hypothetical protein
VPVTQWHRHNVGILRDPSLGAFAPDFRERERA